MPHVMLKKTWNGTFKRCVRDKDGTILKTLSFTAGELVDLPDDDVPAIINDLGKALIPMEYSEEFRKFVPVPMEELDKANPVGPPDGGESSPVGSEVDSNANSAEGAETTQEVPNETAPDSTQESASQEEASTDGPPNPGKRSRK